MTDKRVLDQLWSSRLRDFYAKVCAEIPGLPAPRAVYSDCLDWAQDGLRVMAFHHEGGPDWAHPAQVHFFNGYNWGNVRLEEWRASVLGMLRRMADD
jgi:hypothetical protein